MINLWFKMDNTSILQRCAQSGGMKLINKRNSENMHPPRLERACNFSKYHGGMKNMFKYVLSYMQINGFVSKRH